MATTNKAMNAVRRNTDGTVDDVAITADFFRLEQMSEDEFWAAAYRDGKRICFVIRWDKKAKRLTCTSYDDSIGCSDDTLSKARGQG